MGDEEEPEFDFGAKKKSSKKKKEKKDKDEDKVGDGEEGGEGTQIQVPWDQGEQYGYQDLLTRLYQIIEDKNPSIGAMKKYVMKPPQVIRVGSKKVGWVNFGEICDLMKRPSEHVLQFVLSEFGTEGSVASEGQQLILKGRYQGKHIESLLRRYIKEFVTCEMCKSANTEMVRDSSTRLYIVKCGNCGASRSAASIKSGYHAVTRADRRAARQA
mmetsp:Transcript_34062/g.77678  ORF Transcript_34062/g.77678 Transcript_34062/m.77678 type:complete len:214 (+) Transcript_34062:76-717(+)